MNLAKFLRTTILKNICEGLLLQIEVIGPSNGNKVDYFYRKHYYYINTQATIGANLVFLDLATAFQGGSVYISRGLQHSTLYRNAEQR